MVDGFINAYEISCEFEPCSGEVYSIQHYVIKFVSELRQVSAFLWFPPPKKTYRHDITEIVLKVALNTITKPIITSIIYYIVSFD